MSSLKDEVSIRYAPKKYGSQYRLIKDLITHFESTPKDRISNNQRKLVENSNQHHILRWACAHLRFQFGNQSYNGWELQSTCINRILLKSTHPVISQEYVVPQSSLTRDLRKICPLLQSINPSHLQNRVQVGGISPAKVREIAKMTLLMKKAG